MEKGRRSGFAGLWAHLPKEEGRRVATGAVWIQDTVLEVEELPRCFSCGQVPIREDKKGKPTEGFVARFAPEEYCREEHPRGVFCLDCRPSGLKEVEGFGPGYWTD